MEIKPIDGKFRIADMNRVLESHDTCEFANTGIVAKREHARGTRGTCLTRANKILNGATIESSRPNRGNGNGSLKKFEWNIKINQNADSQFNCKIELPTESTTLWGADFTSDGLWNINHNAIDKGIMRVIESLYTDNPRVNECDSNGVRLTDGWAWETYTSNAKTLESALIDIVTAVIKDGKADKIGQIKPVQTGERKLNKFCESLK